MDNQLIIFTYSLKSDTFLYAELLFLSKKYHQIHIFQSLSDTLFDRKLPDNIQIHHFEFATNNKKNIVPFIKTMAAEVFHFKYLHCYLFKLRYYFAQFNTAYNNAQELLIVLNTLSVSSNSVFYTYWFDNWTHLLSILKSEKKINTLITRIHGGDVYEYQHKEFNFFFPFRNFQIQKLNKIIAISNDGLNHISKTYPACKNKVALSRLGTSDNGISHLKSNGKSFVLVSCSSFYHFKNVSLIPQILAQIKFSLHWIHIGSDGDEIELVKDAVKKLPSNITVEFKGQLSQEKVFDFYKNNYVDLFINTSKSEGLPVSLMEAISFGIPIMAPNVGGIKEIVTKETGILFEPNKEIEQLANYIVELNNKTRIFNRDVIRKFWEINYSAEINYRQFLKLIEPI